MLRSALAIASVVLCTGLLAACGGSDSSSSTETATVPSGKLGAQGAAHCTPPQLDGATVTAFSARNMACDRAVAGVESVYRTGLYSGWNCQVRPSGRRSSADCTNGSNSSQSFSVDWEQS